MPNNLQAELAQVVERCGGKCCHGRWNNYLNSIPENLKWLEGWLLQQNIDDSQMSDPRYYFSMDKFPKAVYVYWYDKTVPYAERRHFACGRASDEELARTKAAIQAVRKVKETKGCPQS